jgi:ribosome-associated translation inhibitor RaiA
MQVLFMSRHPDGARLRDFAERRLRFVLRRLAWRVVQAKVRLADVNGERGGIDKRCRIELKTDGKPIVVATSAGADWRAAINAALSRAVRLLVRQWRRGAGRSARSELQPVDLPAQLSGLRRLQ